MPSKWMADAKLRALFNAGLTYDEIAEQNDKSEGWRPSRSGVLRKLERMGLPGRRHSNKILIPWTILPEHNQDRIRYMLQAESRARTGEDLSETDGKLTAMLHDLLFGRGKLMVVGYHPQIGFHLLERTDDDEDIIRAPREAGQVKADIQAAMRTLPDEELAKVAASEGLRPELLENAGRDRAADLLRKLHANADALAENNPDEAPAPRGRRNAC